MKLDKYIELAHKITQLKHNAYMNGLNEGWEQLDAAEEYYDETSKLFKEILNELMEEVH